MATLTTADFANLKKRIKHDSVARSTFKAWALDKATWYALFQAAEDWFVNGFSTQPTTSYKAALEAIAGTMTNPQAIQVGKVWMGWRYTRFMET